MRPCPFALPILAAALPAQISWSPLSVDEALSIAQREQRVVAIALTEDGERLSEEFLADHYKDARLAKLAAATITLFASTISHTDKTCPRAAPGLPCEQHRKVAAAVQARWVKPDDEGWMITPHHLFIGPDGRVLTSAAYALTKGELEWCWVDAIRRANPGFAWDLATGAHAPLRLLVGAVREATVDDLRPPGAKEVADLLARIKKGNLTVPETIGNIATLARGTDEPIQKHLKATLANAVLTQEERATLLHQIGRAGATVLWDEVAPYIAWKDDELVRREAVVALEQLANRAAADALVARFNHETSDPIRGEILRAVGHTAGANKKAIGLLQEVLTKTKPKTFADELRLQAVIALTHLEDRPTVLALLRTALKDPLPKLRAAAVYVLAVRREKDLLPEMRTGLSAEKDNEVNDAMVAAVGVLDGRDARRFADYLRERAGDKIARDRH